MAYSYRIKTLEESYSLVEAQINKLQQSEKMDPVKLNKLTETKNKYLSELRMLRKAQYDDSQSINFDDDR